MNARENFPIAKWNAFPDYRGMTHDPFIDGLRRWFSENPSKKPATVSAAAGLDKSTIRKLMGGSVRTPKRENAEKIAIQLGMTVEELIAYGGGETAPVIPEPPSVAVPGKVGAGAPVDLFDGYEKGDGMYHVACPTQLSPNGIVAVEVEGDSMEPVYSEGDVLFFSRATHEAVPTEAVNKKVIAQTLDGKVWVKHLKMGSEPGKFHLLSINPSGENMHDVSVRWAAPVRLHLPAEFVERVAE